jgi:hypothetical protein
MLQSSRAPPASPSHCSSMTGDWNNQCTVYGTYFKLSVNQQHTHEKISIFCLPDRWLVACIGWVLRRVNSTHVFLVSLCLQADAEMAPSSKLLLHFTHAGLIGITALRLTPAKLLYSRQRPLSPTSKSHSCIACFKPLLSPF